MPSDPHPSSRLHFHKPLPTPRSPQKRITLGTPKSATSSVPFAVPVKRTQSAAEKMMRNVLTGQSGVKKQDSLYEKLKTEAQSKTSSSPLSVPGRVLSNVGRDLGQLLGAAGKAVAGVFRSKAKKPATKAPVKKTIRRGGFLSEILRTGLVAGGTFAVAMVAMNWTAYASIARFSYARITGEQSVEQQQMEQLVEPPRVALATDVVDTDSKLPIDPDASAPTLPKAGLERPPLTLDVMPPDNRLVIPKLGKNVPIVEVPDRNLIKQDWKALEKEIQDGLLEGVVHYPGTAAPGTKGNFFVTGHSSFYAWAHSKYKDVFALLPELEVGDRVTAYYDQRKYTYQIESKTVVSPSDTSPLKATPDQRITIMTCVPVGTDLNRLILVGKLVESDKQ